MEETGVPVFTSSHHHVSVVVQACTYVSRQCHQCEACHDSADCYPFSAVLTPPRAKCALAWRLSGPSQADGAREAQPSVGMRSVQTCRQLYVLPISSSLPPQTPQKWSAFVGSYRSWLLSFSSPSPVHSPTSQAPWNGGRSLRNPSYSWWLHLFSLLEYQGKVEQVCVSKLITSWVPFPTDCVLWFVHFSSLSISLSLALAACYWTCLQLLSYPSLWVSGVVCSSKF